MATLHILSAGAAQAVVENIIAQFKGATGHAVVAEFGAVGAMQARLAEGFPADVIVLTAAMIDDLAKGGTVVAGTRADLGKVGTGVAHRTGTPAPDLSSADALRGTLLSSAVIAFPDPATATAGKIVMQMLADLGVDQTLKDRLKFFPNGNAAMRWLAATTGSGAIGITQATEIIPIHGVEYAGPLPEAFQKRATYSAGVPARGANPGLARDFIDRLTAPEARPMLAAAGYEF